MEFHADVPIANFKLFSAILDLFSNLSEVVSIDVRNNQFILSALNHSRTAQGLVRISPRFFQDYKLLRNGTDGTAMYCTVSNKNFNNLFKKNVGSIESVELIKISITQGSVDREQHTEAVIQLKLIYKNRVTKKSSMFYADGDPISSLYPSDNVHNFVMSPLVLKGCLTKFHPKVTDVIFQCTPHTICIKSYWDEHTTSSEQPLQTSHTVSSNDCFVYSVIEDVKVVCNLKEFKAYIDFIDYIEDNVTASFECVGKPILFSYRYENLMKLDLALMTQGDANEDPTGGIPMDDFTIDSISTSDIFRPSAPAQASSRSRNNHHQQQPQRQRQQQQQQQRERQQHEQQQQQRRPGSSSSAGSSRSQRSFHTRTTVPASAENITDASSARSNISAATTIPAVPSSIGASDAGSNKSIPSSTSSIPHIVELDDDEENEEPLFRKHPLSSSRREVDAEMVDVERNTSRAASNDNSKVSGKVTPTGQRLTTLQHLRLKHQMRNAAAANASASTTPPVTERRENRHTYENRFEDDEERENLLSRIKYENSEAIRDNDDIEPRKRRHLVHRD